MKLLENKTAIITGATRGIGRGIAVEFAKQGANVAFTYSSSVEAANSLEAALTSLGVKAKGYQSNAAEFDTSQELVKEVLTEFGSIDILVNNAGITKDNLTIRMSLEEWTKVIDINLTSTFLMCKYSIKKMLKNKSGKIVNITSVVGHTGNVGQANYTASKAGIVAMSKSLAIEYAKKNININCISPGFISTAMTDQIDEKYKEAIIAKIPSNKLGKPEDIANAVTFLSSDQSDYINGETLHVNGGMYLG